MKRALTTIAVATVAVIGFAGTASADVSTNGTTNDAWGYCIANHLANFNGENNGIGHIRSTQTGAEKSAHAKVTPEICTVSQGWFDPISNNG